MTPLLEVRDLAVALPTARGLTPVLRGISFAMPPGGSLGLVGESGSGKSMLAYAVMGLLPPGAVRSGQVMLAGEDLTALPERAMQRLRGRRIAMTFQEPMTALNPVQPIGRQVAEPLVLHAGLSWGEAEGRAVRLLDRVGIAQAAQRAHDYPHRLSGGQRQRVLIAMALAAEPELLVADEPTSALDALVGRQVLDLLRELIAERGMGLILISHDLDAVASVAVDMAVIYGGIIVERGPTAAVVGQRLHPYTDGLFAARPALDEWARDRRARPHLPTIPGLVPEIGGFGPGCPFAGRCPLVVDPCRPAIPAERQVQTGHHVACIRVQP